MTAPIGESLAPHLLAVLLLLIAALAIICGEACAAAGTLRVVAVELVGCTVEDPHRLSLYPLFCVLVCAHRQLVYVLPPAVPPPAVRLEGAGPIFCCRHYSTYGVCFLMLRFQCFANAKRSC